MVSNSQSLVEGFTPGKQLSLGASLHACNTAGLVLTPAAHTAGLLLTLSAHMVGPTGSRRNRMVLYEETTQMYECCIALNLKKKEDK